MYNLYYSPGSCSMATHVLLRELGQNIQLLPKGPDFEKVNPAKTVPVLVDGNNTIQEGAAIALYLMEKHESALLPKDFQARSKAIQWMMFANASVHPAYSKMFFIMKNVTDAAAKEEALTKAGEAVTELWKIAEAQLSKTQYLNGNFVSMADIMLSVYANWNNFFPGKISLGANTTRMIKEVAARPAFQTAIETEKIKYNV